MLATIRRTARFAKIAESQPARHPPVSAARQRQPQVPPAGWPGHLLAVEVHLRPVLVELGATVPSRSLYVTEPEFADPAPRWRNGPRPPSLDPRHP